MTEKASGGLGPFGIGGLVVLVLAAVLVVPYLAQRQFDPQIVIESEGLPDKKTEYEISKLEAEISRIRSDTAGSLFWLKLIALFVTVGGAVGGYLVGQSRTTIAKLNFEDRKNVDEVYQSIVQELADQSPILRAAAAVKLGAILKSFPAEWNVSASRKDQLVQLTKQVLAASLSIETDQKVLKTISISIALHPPDFADGLARLEGMDLSGAKAEDAYWARCNFEYADFYAADLSRASLRKSDLSGAQFRETDLTNAVLAESICKNTNFKMADLRGVSFDGATLDGTNFEYAKVYDASLVGSIVTGIPDCQVDVSKKGDGSKLISVAEWLAT